MTSADMEDRKNNNVTDDNGGLSFCSEHEHFPIEVVDLVINMRTEDVFTHIFTDSQLFREFTKRRNTFDLHLPAWSETPDENGCKTRVIRYTLSMNYTIGPKTSASVETQRMYPESQPGQFYLIDADCANGGVPYADDFYTSVRYCMTRASETSTRLRISGKVVYRKRMWGLMKNFIDKTASAGVKTSFNTMVTLLKEQSEGRLRYQSTEGLNNDSPVPRPRRGGRHRVRSTLAGGDVSSGGALDPDSPPQPPLRRKNRPNASMTQYAGSSNVTDILAGVLFIIVLILVIVHIVFYVQLSALEETVSKALAVKNTCV